MLQHLMLKYEDTNGSSSRAHAHSHAHMHADKARSLSGHTGFLPGCLLVPSSCVPFVMRLTKMPATKYSN